jgi:hypothetical protein
MKIFERNSKEAKTEKKAENILLPKNLPYGG